MDSVTVVAPAKLNLGLQVLGRRGDGFHDIRSLFTTVPLFDGLTVSLVPGTGGCTVSCDGMELPAVNTITTAYDAFCVLTGIRVTVHVTVDKHIPAGGGLGGGSSDASSFLQSLDTLCGTHLDAASFDGLASAIGSDVFFFTRALLDAGQGKPYAAVVEGRGERVTPVPPRTDFAIVLVFPGTGVSTKEAYGWVDERLADGEKVRLPLGQLYNTGVHDWTFKNDFTPCVVQHCPVVGQALEALRRSGADFAEMSGSGSTVFGIFESQKKALYAQREISRDWRSLLL